MVPLFGLEGLGNEAGGGPVLVAPQGDPVHLQDDLAHLQLAAVMSRAPPLRGKRDRRRSFRSTQTKHPVFIKLTFGPKKLQNITKSNKNSK